jgi:hypothetical protein
MEVPGNGIGSVVKAVRQGERDPYSAALEILRDRTRMAALLEGEDADG